jgi:hypothetical protein
MLGKTLLEDGFLEALAVETGNEGFAFEAPA